jgi:hypothetical protein
MISPVIYIEASEKNFSKYYSNSNIPWKKKYVCEYEWWFSSTFWTGIKLGTSSIAF